MKELSIEQKAKAYDKAVINGSRLWECGEITRENYEYIFPELKESDDERIRKHLISLFEKFVTLGVANECETSEIKIDNILSWLEKQGKENPLKGTLGDVFDDLKLGINPSPKQGEHKSVDKVEPKFKAGDWIVFNGFTLYVKEVVKGYYRTISKGGIVNSHDWDIDNVARFWNIQDAKDGDVLTCENGWTCIFKTLVNDETFSSYCFMNSTKWFCETGSECHTLKEKFVKAYNGKIYPATKEQREQLEKAISDAGFMWDAEKKELRKIVAPIFHIGDRVRYKEHACDGIITEITDTDYICGNAKLPISTQDKLELVEQKLDDNIDSSSFKDKLLKLFQKFRYIKEGIPTNGDIIDYVDAHIQELIDTIQNKLVWSEEEKRNIELLVSLCKNEVSRLKEKGSISEEWYEIEEAEDWLKSLKDRVQPQSKQEWSEEDREKLSECCSIIKQWQDAQENYYFEQRFDYSNWLKSLKDRVQPKKELSEEDKTIVDSLLDVLYRIKKGKDPQATTRLIEQHINFIKSLKERYTRKPRINGANSV